MKNQRSQTSFSIELERRLQNVLGEACVDVSRRRLAEYSSDASNYRVVPQAVVFPKFVGQVEDVLNVCRELNVPLTIRGGGTSCAGNSIGEGVILDFSRHLNRVTSINPETRTAEVEPGVVLDRLQRAARPHGLRFGPDPSSHARCTLGGMIGNNACGAHAMSWGTTASNVLALDVVDGGGRRWNAESGAKALDVVQGLDSLADLLVRPIANEFGRFSRQVSGYGLHHLLPEHDSNVARALVGTEGTCAVVLGAELRLVEVPPARALVVLGYPDMATSADAISQLLAFHPLALEGIDRRIVDVVKRHRGANAVPSLPSGDAWLFVEVGGETAVNALQTARHVATSMEALEARVVPEGSEFRQLWAIREDGAGLSGRTADGAPAWPAWEDAAVPPLQLGNYLRSFEELMTQHHLQGLLYGHFGDGCVHVRLDLPLADHSERLRPFLLEAAGLVTSYGGSLSGEHGDGRARSELLPIMYSPSAIGAMHAFKRLLDPEGILNPGVVVVPAPVDVNLRLPSSRSLKSKGGFELKDDSNDLAVAVHRCVGIGKCRSEEASDSWMCPSYLATKDEKDSTRGRARVLQEMANGTLVNGWDAPEVEESLDLCLSCKACARDCPASVDMATYKSQVLFRRYKGKRRPSTHYTLGRLPVWLNLATRAPRMANRAMSFPPISKFIKVMSGIDQRREVPTFAKEPLDDRRLESVISRINGDGPFPLGKAVLWVDSFTRAFSPEIVMSACEVITAAGYEILIPNRMVCCGLTWISTGQLDQARKRLLETVSSLATFAHQGIPIVGLEPSCVATLRGDLVELLGESNDALAVARAIRTLAELLIGSIESPNDLSWLGTHLSDVSVVVQPHCHHYSVMGWGPDQLLLESLGVTAVSTTGCCGLAGNFGMEIGHYELSVQVAQRSLLPSLRSAADESVFLADGFSCRTQAQQLQGVRGFHLAQLLATSLNKRAE